MPKFLNRAQVISHLLAFKHGVRTNFAKRTLTNHDAIAYILWSLGPQSVREIRDIMSEWRFGTSERKKVKVRRWSEKAGKVVPGHVWYSPIGLGYLFNTCSSGGYSFVADRMDQRGHVMRSTRGYIYRERGTGIGAMKAKANAGKKNEPGECVFFRRTYWYRVAKGTYAPTLECAKRMSEIKHFFK